MTIVSAPTRRAVLAGAIAIAALPAAPVAAAPKSKLIDQRWKTTGSGGDPDAGPWAAFLSAHLSMGGDGVARIDYAGAKAAGADKALSAWLADMQAIDPTTLSSAAAQAYWINLYNAVTIDVVLAAYPVKTILRIDGGVFNTGPWDEKRAKVNGVELSLDNIEHGILRPVWRDARVHYAVNCASIGCPNLDPKPWSSGDLDARYDAAAAAYVNHPRGARVEDGELIVSKIYEWFEEDFGGSSEGVISHLKGYATGDLAAGLEGATRIADTEYDWDLNDA